MVFDPGLQLERTTLAWRRTLLTLAVGFLVAGRGLLPLMGVASYGIAVGGLAITAVLAVLVERRHRARHGTLTASASLASGGRLVFALALLTLVGALLALTWVLLRR